MKNSLRIIRSTLIVLVVMLSSHVVAADEQLTDQFQLAFTKRNPLLVDIQIMESKALSLKKNSSHVFLVHAIRSDKKFEGKFEDEQFGVFLVNADQNKILTVLDMFNTPRWNDYEIKLKRVSSSKVVIAGKGATYGDHSIAKTYGVGG
jgi:hypothetical protein